MVSNRSTDNTCEVAKSLGIKVLVDNRAKGGIGYGFAHMTGLKATTGDLIVSTDADGTYPIENLAKIIDFMMENKINFVSCNRYPVQKDTKIPLFLRLGVMALNLETRILYGKKIKDILSGMWIIDKKIKNELNLSEGDWNLSPQIKLNAATNPKINFTEYQISQHQRLGQTKQSYFRTGLSHLLWIAKNRFFKHKLK